MIGEQIAFFRKRKNLTQGQLGEMLGVSNRTVSKWEAGDSLPSADIIPGIAGALGVSLDEIFGKKAAFTEKGTADLIREAIRAEMENILPGVLADALADAGVENLTGGGENARHELIVWSKDKRTVTKTVGEARIEGPTTLNGTPGNWLLTVVNGRGEAVVVGTYDAKEEAVPDLQALLEAYAEGKVSITL